MQDEETGSRVDVLFPCPDHLTWEQFCDELMLPCSRGDGIWGDNNTLIGVSAAYDIYINIVTEDCGSTEWLTCACEHQKDYPKNREIYIAFSQARVHYYGTAPSRAQITKLSDLCINMPLLAVPMAAPVDTQSDSGDERISHNSVEAGDDDTDSNSERHDDSDSDECIQSDNNEHGDDDNDDDDDSNNGNDDNDDAAGGKENNSKQKANFCEVHLVDAILRTGVHSVSDSSGPAMLRELRTLLQVKIDLNKLTVAHGARKWQDIFTLIYDVLKAQEDEYKSQILPANNKLQHLLEGTEGTTRRLQSLLYAKQTYNRQRC
jgi:hypothetical protein